MAVVGVQQTIRSIGAMIKKKQGSIVQNLRAAAQVTKRKADKYCPVDTGDMKSTGRIDILGTGAVAEATLTYGDTEKAPYTVYVHENLEARHDWPTRAKWLEVAFRETRLARRSITQRLERGEILIIDDEGNVV